jgi:hypothetical protein
MKLLTILALFTTAVLTIGCGGGGVKVETAKEVLTSHKWYSSKNCEDIQESRQYTFSSNKVEIVTYDNPDFKDKGTKETHALEYKDHEIYLQVDGEDKKCLISSDSDKEWAILQCIPVDESEEGEKIVSLYKTKEEAINNNTELCEDKE